MIKPLRDDLVSYRQDLKELIIEKINELVDAINSIQTKAIEDIHSIRANDEIRRQERMVIYHAINKMIDESPRSLEGNFIEQSRVAGMMAAANLVSKMGT